MSNGLLDNLLLTRFKDRSLTSDFLSQGEEYMPSIAAHRYNPLSKNYALDFGDYGLLVSPEWLDPSKSVVYARDMGTPRSPTLFKGLPQDELSKIAKLYGLPEEDIDDVAAAMAGRKDKLNDEEFVWNLIDRYELQKNFRDLAAKVSSEKAGSAEGSSGRIERGKFNFYRDLFSYLADQPTITKAKIPLDRESLKENIYKKQKDRSYWVSRTEEMGLPLKDWDAVNRVLMKLLINNKNYWSQEQEIGNSVIDEMSKQFNSKTGELQKSMNEEPKEGEKFNRIPINSIDSFLHNMNKVVRGERGKFSPHEREAGETIKKAGTDFMEVKPPERFTRQDYLGAIYPVDENYTSPEQKKVIEQIHDTYGSNAIPYKKSNMDSEDKEKYAKMEALKKLAQRVGIMSKKEGE